MEELIELAPPEERYRFSATFFFLQACGILVTAERELEWLQKWHCSKTGHAKILFSDRTSYSAFQSPSELAEPQNVPRPMSP